MNDEYNLELVKELLSKNDYVSLNQIINDIMRTDKHNINDLEIVKYLSECEALAIDSRDAMNKLYQQYNEELKQSSNNIEALEIESAEKQKPIESFNERNISDENLNESLTVSITSEEYLTKKFSDYGLTVREISKSKDYPHISFEINNLSKPYIDNLMIQLYNDVVEIPGIGFDLTKLVSTNEEIFTVNLLDNENLDIDKIDKLFKKVEDVVDDTDKDRNYEEVMPSNLKNMKSQFVNDAPDIPKEDFRIGYANFNGTDNFYVTSPNNNAMRLTEEMGYIPRKVLYDGTVEIETFGENLDGTKLEESSVPVEKIENLNNVVRTEELNKSKVLTLGPRPNTNTESNAAYANTKSIVLIIMLIILVIAAVTFLTIRG